MHPSAPMLSRAGHRRSSFEQDAPSVRRQVVTLPGPLRRGRPEVVDKQPIVPAPPESYLQWNDAIASRIFRPEMAGRAVFLYVDERLIESIGGPGSLPAFVQATSEGPPWAKPGSGLCQKALQAQAAWRNRGVFFPPYLAYLAVFVLAVGVAGDFPTHAYYPRLWKLLGREDNDLGAPPSFDRMLSLWDDLEVWSNRDRGGDLGVFSVRFAGNWIHVGLPKAQAILTEQERRDLTKIFVAAALDPTEPPNDIELASTVRRHGAGILRHATLELLKNPNAEPELFSILLDVVSTELEEWDGEWDDAGGENTLAVARLCMRVDIVSKRATLTLRISSSADFPQEGLALTHGNGNRSPEPTYGCEEHLPGWSSPLRSNESGVELSATALDWRRTLEFIDRRSHWRVRFPARRIRIFVDGLSFQLPGLVEVWRLPRDRAFTIAAHEDLIPHLLAWNNSGEVRLNEVSTIEGLPNHWRLYASVGATGDLHIRNPVPELALPSAVRMKLIGGIKSSEGNSFFDFARPTLSVAGAASGDQVWIGSTRLLAGSDADTRLLPKRLPLGEPITAEVRSEANVRRRLTFFLEDESDWRQTEPNCFADGLGTRFLTSDADLDQGPWFAGASLRGPGPTDSFPVWPETPNHGHWHLLGRRVGEIVASPRLPFEFSWPAIWILDSREGRIHFCGTGISSSEPLAEPEGDRQAIRLWREVVWNRRRRFALPRNPKLGALWKRYLEVAGDARG